eukprot:CAMPEP_0171243686 /NCGR_PEP_ID=MMETSP0790-20130122/46424_1 /TAXON_ID=2925 /ORGANISM="Alexandrium catenella, Strain OF101" /LENGTH=30 /DNA_ID= /DNA_START= /DNA_END= /DNA_ORIENTATION=
MAVGLGRDSACRGAGGSGQAAEHLMAAVDA